MRLTRTWTISLPPEMNHLAQEVAKREHRTKSELVREALRLYFSQRAQPRSVGAGERLARVGEMAAFYQRRHPRALTERELRQTFRGIRRMHDRLKRVS